MLARRLSLAFLTLGLAACFPRQPVAPAPMPTPDPPPTLVVSALDEARARERRAERFFDEGISLGRQSRWAEAADRYRLAAEANPGEPRYPLALADALLASGREWEAADALLAGIRVEEGRPQPNHRVLAVDYERLIRLLTRLNRLDEARTAQAQQARHRQLRDANLP